MRKRVVICHSRSPHVQELIRLVNETDHKMAFFAREVGVADTTVMDWCNVNHGGPSITNMEAAFNVLGYTLVIQPLTETPKPRTQISVPTE